MRELRYKEKATPKEQVIRYAVSLLLVALVFIVKLLLYSTEAGRSHPFLLNVLPVFLVGLLVGLGPSIVAFVLTTILLYFYYLPHAGINFLQALRSPDMFAYILEGLLIVWVIELERRSHVETIRLNRSLDQQVKERTAQLEAKRAELAETNKRLTNILQKAMDESPRSRTKD